MSEREPESMEAYFADVLAEREATHAPAAATPDEGAGAGDESLDAGVSPEQPVDESTPRSQAGASGEAERLARIERELELLRLENAKKEEQLTSMLQSARASAEQQRQQEILRARARWERGLATGELSDADVIKEREQLIARHATDRIMALETENQHLRSQNLERQELDARTQVITMLTEQFGLTEREQKYINQLTDPWQMEAIAAQFREDRQSQTQAARQTRAAQRGPVDRAPGGSGSAARSQEPDSMLSYFKQVHR